MYSHNSRGTQALDHKNQKFVDLETFFLDIIGGTSMVSKIWNIVKCKFNSVHIGQQSLMNYYSNHKEWIFYHFAGTWNWSKI